MSRKKSPTVLAGTVDRRQFSLGVLIASVATLGGCALLRQESAIDVALDELQAALEPLQASGSPEMASVARTLRDQVWELVREHDDFNKNFDLLARDRTVEDAELMDMAVRYEADRVATRNALLETQAALLATIPADSREEVFAILSDKATSLAPARGAES